MDVVTLGQKRLTEFHRFKPPRVSAKKALVLRRIVHSLVLLLDQDKVDVVGTSELNFDLLDSATPNDDASACRSHNMDCRYRTLSFPTSNNDRRRHESY